jgi:phospholipid/cholesterol/gamma-HCH transport system substrate-binding protein
MSRLARLGAFVVATLAILIVGIFIVGDQHYLFTETYQLKTQFSDVVGLNVGAETRIGGVHRGTVIRIDMPRSPADKITVVMDLESSTRDIIRKDSVATIATEGLLGDEYISISFGSVGAPEVRNGDTLASQQPIAMADLIKKTDKILDSSQQAVTNVTQVTANLSAISGKINDGQGTVGALINDKDVYTKLDQTMSGMQETALHAQAGVTDFQEDMEALKHNFFLRGYFKNRGYEDSSEVEKDEIVALPQAAPLKTFTFDAKQLFDKQGNAKLKNQKSLSEAGDYLADHNFGVAVVVASTGLEGDSAKNLTLTEGRAMVVREFLVENFGFDDSRLKTLGLGKKEDASSKSGWGEIRIMVYPIGTPMPAEKAPASDAAKSTSNQAVPQPAAVTNRE